MTKKVLLVLGLCFLVVVVGCGRKLDPPVEPGQAGAVLRAALDAWKGGAAFGDLEKRDIVGRVFGPSGQDAVSSAQRHGIKRHLPRHRGNRARHFHGSR